MSIEYRRCEVHIWFFLAKKNQNSRTGIITLHNIARENRDSGKTGYTVLKAESPECV